MFLLDTLGEVEQGAALVASAARRAELEHWGRYELPAVFAGRVLPVDVDVARAWGRLSAAGRHAGRPLPAPDGLILATAQVHALTLVTRNLRDCAGRGVPTLDSWV